MSTQLQAASRIKAANKDSELASLSQQLAAVIGKMDQIVQDGGRIVEADPLMNQKRALERKIAALRKTTRLHSSTEVVADAEESDERHWLLRVKSVLRLAKGQGAMKISEADEEHNTVTVQMKPAVYLDPTIMVKLLLIFKKENLAMVITAHTNLIELKVGPEGFLEAETGAKV